MKTYWKDIFREIWKTRGRFLAILAIIALGTGFFAGIKVACSDLKETADSFYKEHGLMDFRLASTYGVTEEDIAALEAREDVAQVMPGYSADVLANTGSGDFVLKLMAFDGPLNSFTVKEGRLPQASGEIAIERVGAAQNIAVGDEIELASGNDDPLSDTLKVERVRVVGIVESPLYPGEGRGTANIGSGSVECVAVIPTSDFALEVYTDAYITLRETQNLAAYTAEYDDTIAAKQKELEAFAAQRGALRLEEIREEANTEIADAKQELADGEAEMNEELAKAQKELDDAKAELEKGEKELADGRAALEKQEKDGQAQIDSARKELEAGERQYEELQAAYETNKAQADASLPESKAALEELKGQMDSLSVQIAALEEASPEAPELPQMKAQLAAMQEQYDAGMAEIEKAEAGLKQMEDALASMRSQLDSGKSELEKNEKALRDGIAQGKQKLAEAETELARGKEEYTSGEAEYQEEKAKAEQELADARQEIADAEQELADLETPEWYVLSRADYPGYTEYGENAESIDKISLVLPVFFILIAVLVCLTTMTRMVEERRTQIGTLKALGFGTGKIVSKYMVYAFASSLMGSVIGLLIGFKVFPWACYTAFRISYPIFPMVHMPFHWEYAGLCTAAAVLATLLATFAACRKELRESPASLMRPKAPKAGRRMLLEKFGSLWKRISFAYKVTLRNFVRYKKRVLMTIVGIAGCTALMLAGFGLRYSITSVIPRQFGEIFHYDGVAAEKDGASGQEKEALLSAMEEGGISGHLAVLQKTVTAAAGDNTLEANLIVPEEPDKIGEFISLRTREGKQQIDLAAAGTVVSEKLANRLELEVGDAFALRMGDEEMTLRVGGITENYTQHFVYVTPEAYAQAAGKAMEENAVFFTLASEDDRDAVSERLVQEPAVLAVSLTQEQQKTMEDSMGNLSIIVLVIILSAGALAVVVLYNLMNINIAERTRELATIKVLGFREGETAAYVYRENILCTVIGIAVGLVLGTFLKNFILSVAELESMMFAPETDVWSYVFSAGLTLAFTFLVNGLFFFKLRRLNMAESMKSVE